MIPKRIIRSKNIWASHQFTTRCPLSLGPCFASANPTPSLLQPPRSPDGSCFLTSSEDNTLRLFSLSDYGSSDQTTSYSSVSEEDSYAAQLVVSEGESVYDFCWYPFMSSSGSFVPAAMLFDIDPVSCVFATCTLDHPIHLWDATSGLLRFTYRAYDAVDEITAAFSVLFNPAGTKVFDVHLPGCDFAQYSTLQGNKEGQTGIISSIAFCPTHTGMLATGSYSQTTAIYREDNMELLYVLHGQGGGVTHVSQHLSTGGQDGLVHIYDLQTGQWVSGFQAAADTVNGFSFHPFLPMAVSSSGHRRFQNLEDDTEDEDLHLRGDENCASVWNFSYDVTSGQQS
ncbi:Transducin/WD40 repeat-like superfamily protein isoform 2 [Hibiscus syriacus]|uniref:Transducin/WD40 repeat-like superfamily protein isoform 2 n=1 Tax=Hibiscus syriacus TaxID=106335 RepID=A0A6A3BZE3_HIBSY|nr:Transducin/WD40 repeat-like superfamily protein isoform 2 [Hibiscus syriacus]